MTTAIFGLVGVLIGGLLTFGTELLLERRRAINRYRRAVRLVSSELLQLAGSFRAMGLSGPPEAGEQPSGIDFAKVLTPTELWHEHRAEIADHAPHFRWQLLSSLYSQGEFLRYGLVEPEIFPELHQYAAEYTATAGLAEALGTWLQEDPYWRDGDPVPDEIVRAVDALRAASGSAEALRNARTPSP